MSRDTKADARAINTILWKDWDPIGCSVPEDEYWSYVWPVYKLLVDGAPREAIMDHLRWVAETYFTVSAPENRLQMVVDKLIALGVKPRVESQA
ncbi:MAG: hypothetical protein ABL871_04055 [Terricaulis sp.]